jgi:hypothetical protein
LNLSKSNEALRKSLGRLSSGKRIMSPADDAGGLAVALKLASKTNRAAGAIQNVHRHRLGVSSIRQTQRTRSVGCCNDCSGQPTDQRSASSDRIDRTHFELEL